MRNYWIVTGLTISTLAFGCSSSGTPNIDVEGCEHLKEGPPVAVTAAATADLAPAVDADHMRYDVALIDVTGGKGGFVKYAAPEATDYLFFLGADVPVQFLDAANAPVAPEESTTSSTVCTEIKGRHLIELAVGTYAIKIGPTAQTSVGIVVEEAAHAPH